MVSPSFTPHRPGNRGVRWRDSLAGVLVLAVTGAESFGQPAVPQRPSAPVLEGRRAEEELEQLQPEKKPPEGFGQDRLKKSIIDYQTPETVGDEFSFELAGVVFDPQSVLLDPETLEQLARRYVGREVTFSDLKNLRVDVINLYQQAGYVLSIANIPPQELDDGILRVQLVESKVQEIQITGNTYLPDSYFLQTVGDFQGRYFNTFELEKDLIRFNKTSKASMYVRSSASETFGHSDLEFVVYEPPRFSVGLSGDNLGTERLGEWRVLANASANGLTNGVDDNLAVGTTQAEGSSSVYGFYDRPLNRLGTRMNVSATHSSTEVVDGSADSLSIEGSSDSLSLGATHPLWVTWNSTVRLTLGFRHYESESFFVADRLDDSTSYFVDLGLSADHRDASGEWFGDLTLNRGDSQRFDDPSQTFHTLNLNLSRRQRISQRWGASLRMSGQWSDDKRLPSIGSFYLGGQSSVRGFEDGTALGYAGADAQLELSVHPFLGSVDPESSLNSLRLSLFQDAGIVYTDKGGDIGTDSDVLSSTGVSLAYQPLSFVSLSLGYAAPHDVDPLLQNEKNWTFQLRCSKEF